LGFKVDYGKLPIAKEALRRIDSKKAALYFGGDYQLLITTKKKDFPEVMKALKKLGTNLTAIGKATKKGDKVLIMDNRIEPLENISYEHFR
ncbi:MAG: hypothetical protein KAI64_05105, partial [Thermoplasmata archaeon]|nr:hypothetical protein [Thermoplasmata archaeon]